MLVEHPVIVCDARHALDDVERVLLVLGSLHEVFERDEHLPALLNAPRHAAVVVMDELDVERTRIVGGLGGRARNAGWPQRAMPHD
jgi:hypothetical protein